MTFADLLADVIGRLERAAVPYMVTGSLASSYHGEPRATRDADIVIDPTAPALGLLVDDLLAGGYYVDRGAAFDAFRARTQFNAIGADALKVDFIVRKARPFSIEEFGRRQQADLLGTAGYIATAEDLVIAKLEWAAATDSERQRRDAVAIVRITDDLDEPYIDRWVTRLGLAVEWNVVREAARAE